MAIEQQLLNVPAELLVLPQFVGWKRTQKPGAAKATKIPYNPQNGRLAESDNPETWSNVQDALNAIAAYGLDGVGFVFTAGDEFAGVDLDGCVKDGVIEPEKMAIIAALNSYAEFSPSGTGVHIIVRGRVPKGLKRGNIEIYSSGRYFTMTGNRVPGTPEDIRDAQHELLALYDSLATKKKPAAPAPVPVAIGLDDSQLLELARQAENGAKFSRLFAGDTNGHPSASEADLALCSMLAFWTGRDASAIDRLFRQSGLMRDKWDERHSGDGDTYGQMTVAKALELTSEIYEPSPAGAIIHKGKVIAGAEATAKAIEAPELAAEFFQEAQRFPQLPDSAQIPAENALQAGWLDDYIEFSREESPAAWDTYHEACGLWLLSTLAARRIAVRPTLTVTIWPNQFIALVGVSTLWRKSTTANVARHVLKAVGAGAMVYPYISTAENLISIMRPPRSTGKGWEALSDDERAEHLEAWRWAHIKGLYVDELGVRIHSILNRRGVYAGLYQLLLQAGRGEPLGQHTLGRGLEATEHGYLTLLGSMTPANLNKMGAEDSELWADGFFSRFVFACPPLEARPRTARWRHIEHIPNEVLQPAAEWHKRLGQPKSGVMAILDDEDKPTGENRPVVSVPAPELLTIAPAAYDGFYAYMDALTEIVYRESQEANFTLAPSYASLPTAALRVAMLLASVEGHSQIQFRHWAKAQHIAERWRESLHNLFEQVEEPKADPLAAKVDKVFRAVQDEWRRAGEARVSAGYITRRMRSLSKTEVMDLLGSLAIRRLIKLERGKAENGREAMFITSYEDDEA